MRSEPVRVAQRTLKKGTALVGLVPELDQHRFIRVVTELVLELTARDEAAAVGGCTLYEALIYVCSVRELCYLT